MTDAEVRDSSSQSSNHAIDIEKSGEKRGASHVEQIRTNEKVDGHPGYYEKDGLRTYGDDQDHDVEPPVSSLQFSL